MDTNKRIAVLYHKSDVDGILSGIIAERYINPRNETPCQLFPCEYNEIPIDSFDLEKNFDLIYVLDFSDDVIFEHCHEKIVWIDHHISAINKFKHLKFHGTYLMDGVAACRLTLQYFINLGTYEFIQQQDYRIRNVSEPLFVALAGEYDIWDEKSPYAKAFNFGIDCNWNVIKDLFQRTFGTYTDSIEKGDELGNPFVPQIIKDTIYKGQAVINYIKQTPTRLKGGIKIRLFGHDGRMFNADTRSSLIYELQHGEDFVMVWNVTTDVSKIKVSLYSESKEINVSEIAMFFGGGGHRNAAGFQTFYGMIEGIAKGTLSAPRGFEDV